MIIEIFGPPGVGKTTFSHLLAERLRDRGYTVDLVLTLPRREDIWLNRGGFIPALLRVFQAIFFTIGVLCRPISNARALGLAHNLLRLMPPTNPVWLIRLGQYIARLSCEWRDPNKPGHVVLFDQGLVQAVCTLALFSRADEKTIARAVSMRAHSDLLIRLDAPKELLEQRLHGRARQTTFAERWFEPDVDTFLKAKPIADYVCSLLASQDQRMVCINSADSDLMSKSLDAIEEEVSAKFVTTDGSPGSRPDPEGSSFKSSTDRLTQAASPSETIGASTGQREPELSRRLDTASLWAFVVYVGGAGVTCLAQLVIARKIGAPSYGIYSYVLAWTTFLSYGATLGFNMVLLRFVPAYSSTERWSLARGVVGFAFRRSFIVSLVIAGGEIAVVLALADHMQHELAVSLAIGLATVPLFALYVLGSATVRALGGVISAIAPERLVRDGLLLVLVLLAGMLTATPINATTVLIGLMVSSAVTVAILGSSLRKLWPAQMQSADPSYETRDWWQLAIPVMVMIAAEILMSRAGVILLGWSGDTRSAGVFALGLNLALFLVLPRMAVGTFFSPNVARLHAHRDMTALQNLFSRATVLSLLGTTILALPLLLLAQPLLQFFGPDFVATAPIAQILVIGQLFAAATGPQQNLLTMTGHQWAAAIFLVIGTVINIIACAIGIAFFGAIGAAVATSATNVIWNTTLAVYIHRRLNMVAGLLFAIVGFRGTDGRQIAGDRGSDLPHKMPRPL